MNITTVLTPANIALLPKADLTNTVAVVFDVLRATSTMTTALANGVAAIYPAADIVEALAFKRKYPDALLGGERHGEKIDGFDLGNSPLEYLDRAGREIISTTTNGTVALRAVAHAQTVIAASLLNITAVATHLIQNRPANLLLVCAGTGEQFALEDGLGVGALVRILESLNLPNIQFDDAAVLLASAWGSVAAATYPAIANSKNGKRLIEGGRDAEVQWCAQTDVYSVIGILSGEALCAG